MKMASVVTASLLAGGILIARVDTTRANGEHTQAAAPQGAGAAVRPRIAGIAHVAFRVSAMPAARSFYADVLGLLPLHGARTGRGADDRVRFRVSDRQQVILEPGLPADDDERLSHLAFETASLDALAAYLKAQGIQPETGPPAPARACAARALWVKDPDGHPIEFVERETDSAAGTGGAASAAASAVTVARTPAGGVDPISRRVLHAGLTIRDAEAADRFYKTALGFSEIWRGGRADDVINWINMKVPDGTDYLEYMLASGPVSRQQLGSMHHVALLVPDIQRAYEDAQRRTAPAARATMASPQVGRNRRWQLNLFDPDGTRTELMEPFPMR
jgi:lactoylglutathione lyase